MQTVKIVVCDDDRALQEILRQKIEKFCEDAKIPCSIVCCDSGEEILREEPAPDILFLDIQMPERNGMEIAEELRMRRCESILIFVTVLSEQAGTDFYRSHRAYLVNLKYVEKYTATTIWLEQGTALISKKQFPGFVRRYMQYISGKRSG